MEERWWERVSQLARCHIYDATLFHTHAASEKRLSIIVSGTSHLLHLVSRRCLLAVLLLWASDGSAISDMSSRTPSRWLNATG